MVAQSVDGVAGDGREHVDGEALTDDGSRLRSSLPIALTQRVEPRGNERLEGVGHGEVVESSGRSRTSRLPCAADRRDRAACASFRPRRAVSRRRGRRSRLSPASECRGQCPSRARAICSRRADRASSKSGCAGSSPSAGRRSKSSGRAMLTTKIGRLRDLSSSSRDEVEHALRRPTARPRRQARLGRAGQCDRRTFATPRRAHRAIPPASARAPKGPRAVARPTLVPARPGSIRRPRRGVARGRGRVIALGNAGTAANHLGQRPVADAFAVCRRATNVPLDAARQLRRCTSRTPTRAGSCRCRPGR